jgi:transposase
MHKKVADFLAKNRPKGTRSKLWAHREFIYELRNAGASLRQICRFLEEEEGIHTTHKSLSMFLKSFQKIKSKSVVATPKQEVENIKSSTFIDDEDWRPKIKPGHGLYDF